MGDVQTTLRLNDQATNVLQRVANTARQTASMMQQTGKNIDQAFRSNAPNAFASQAGNAMRTVTSEAENLGNAIDSIFDDSDSAAFASEMENGFRSASAGAEEFASSADNAGEAIDGLASSAEDLGESVDGIGSGGSGLEDVADDAGHAGEEMEQAAGKAINLSGALKTLFAAVGVAKIAGEVKQFVGDSIELGKNYSSMMSEVAAISGATGRDYEMLEQTAREYGATTVFSASEAAEALKYMSLAGWDANQSASALGGVLNLAAASGMGLGQSSDMVTDYLSAFGMEASQAGYFADLLAYAQANSNTSAQQLGEAYLNSAANLHAAGQDIETTTSLLEAMANQGTKGSRAGTQLAAITRDITNSMEDGKITIGDTAIAVQDAQGNFRDLTDILTDVEGAVDGMGSAQRSAALASTFTADSTKGINQILTEGMSNISRYEEELRNSTGAAEKAADIMNDNLEGDVANMNSAFEEMQLQVYEGMEGTLRSGVQHLTSEVIPALTEWVPDALGTVTESVGKVGKVLTPIIDTVLKNPQAVGTAFASIGTGLAAFSAVNKMSGVITAFKAGTLSESGGLIGGLTKLGGVLMAHPWAAAAAGVTAAVVGIGMAIKRYNDLQVEDNLSDHFGNVTLNSEQMEAFADRIIDAEWLVNINASLGHFDNADELVQEAEAALAQNDAIEWKSRVGIELTPDDVEQYSNNIQTFIDSELQALQEQTLAVSLALSFTDIKLSNGSSLSSAVETWTRQDMAEANSLSKELTSTVQKALEDGIINVDEQAAIDELQQKMNNILAGWKEAEATAQMDMLEQQYGRMSGKDLTADTFTELVGKLGEQRETAAEALEQSNMSAYEAIEAMHNKGRLSDQDYDFAKMQVGQASRNEQAEALVNSLNFESNTLSDAYGEKLQENYGTMEAQTQSFLSSANNMLKGGNLSGLYDSLMTANSSAMVGTNIFSPTEQKALNEVWTAMRPDVTEMQGMIDEYREAGQVVPQSVMDGFNEAMQIGAAAGDSNAAWAVFAQEMISDPASQAMEEGILDGTLAVPQELREAVERAAAETTDDPVNFDNVQAKIDGVEVDEGRIQELLGQEIQGLSTGQQTEIEGGELAVDFEVTTAMTAQELADNLGVKVDEIMSANPDIQSDTTLEVGTKIEVSEDKISIDTSSVGAASQEAASQAEEEASNQEPADMKIPAKGTLEVQDTDKSQVGEAVNEATSQSGETAEVTVPANVKLDVQGVDTSGIGQAIESAIQGQAGKAVEVNASANVKLSGTDNSAEMYSKTGEALKSAFGSTIEVSGNTNVTLSQTNNAPEIYSQVGSAVKNAFAAGYSASATVKVTLHADYSLANPSKTISFGGGATGSATVTASLHALGGYFDQEHLGIVAEDGPEYIIPMDGSDRSREMWTEAGDMLGVMDAPIETMPGSAGNGAQGGSGSRTDTKDINLNINGSGAMRVTSNMSKEDVLNVMIENVKDVLMDIIQNDILLEGDSAYEY